jgi:hypothetical protein
MGRLPVDGRHVESTGPTRSTRAVARRSRTSPARRTRIASAEPGEASPMHGLPSLSARSRTRPEPAILLWLQHRDWRRRCCACATKAVRPAVARRAICDDAMLRVVAGGNIVHSGVRRDRLDARIHDRRRTLRPARGRRVPHDYESVSPLTASALGRTARWRGPARTAARDRHAGTDRAAPCARHAAESDNSARVSMRARRRATRSRQAAQRCARTTLSLRVLRGSRGSVVRPHAGIT